MAKNDSTKLKEAVKDRDSKEKSRKSRRKEAIFIVKKEKSGKETVIKNKNKMFWD